MQIVRENNAFVLRQIYRADGWPLVVRRIAESFAELLCRSDISRIKICDNDDCRWTFYDESKNKSRRWCDNKVCGNLMKVRRFRSRQKATQEKNP